MEQADIYSILFVGIDISSRENVVCFLRFGVQQPLKTFSVPNNQPGAQALALSIENYLLEQQNHKVLYEPLTVAIASSFNLITAYNHELKVINAAIEKSIKGLDLNSYTVFGKTFMGFHIDKIQGNTYLRYYLLEATNSVIRH